MTDERIAEIFAFAREAFKGGQKSFQVQAFPFRMTAENMAEHQGNEHFEFWKMLKEGYDHFEITRVPPKVDVCDKRYVFNRVAEDEKAFKPSEACPAPAVPPSLALAYGKLINKEDEVFQKALKNKAVKEAWNGRKFEPPLNASLKPAEMPVPATVVASVPAPGPTGSTVAVTPAGSNVSAMSTSQSAAALPQIVPVPTPAPSPQAESPAESEVAPVASEAATPVKKPMTAASGS
jgi:hypothetical protein